ncbi:EAL domain-containing protein [Domibacillus sp. A3M-37]|uniref:EAL domain-containing protein n=1 Tax=Domibacillus sp. A3M-37 TaxID=2962037 RepID=UPI0020B807F9|nr:EAL domain-containing protein [Domibacillus sp. A3M-37]MCP3763859.1 EAL domain-containing protein [Domibacillus sp. A3M-37]
MSNSTTKNNKLFIYFIAFYILSYYTLIIFFKSYDAILLIGGTILQIVAPLVAGVMLIKQFYRKSIGSIRYFWLLSSLASFSYAIGMAIFRYNFAYSVQYTSLSDLFWYVAIFLFLIALISVMAITKNTSKTIQYIFDIIIVMVVFVSITWYYVIEPIISSALEIGLMYTIVYASYPIGILMVLFALLSLFYSSENVLPKKTFILIILGFFLLLVSNLYYLYLTINNLYEQGSFIDPLWPFAMLLFGLASLYNHEDFKVKGKPNIRIVRKSGEIFDFLTLKLILPYLCVLTIFTFMIFQGVLEINSIVIGSIASTLLIIVRQILTLIQNSELLYETKELNRELEMKVQHRTKELFEKNQQLEESMEKVGYIAYHDSLTGLTNRRYFEKVVKNEIEAAKRVNSKLAIMFIDLDRFKFINDTLGHHIGDLLLISVANKLKSIVGEPNVVSRQGGDEFMILLKNTTQEETEQLAEDIIQELQSPILINGNELFITSSIGISLYPEHGILVDSLIKRADTSMYSAKEQGKNRYQTFNVKMDDHVTMKVNLENGLRKAIEMNELSVVYQPKLELGTGKVVGLEALLRWRNSHFGNVSPSTFIPIAEDTGLITKLGDWVLREACLQIKRWINEGIQDIKVSVNVSTIQFMQKDFIEKVSSILKEISLDPEYLELEITESSTLDMDIAIHKLKRLKQLGIMISIDDFGSGYSSLSHIKNLPIDILKIDKSFIDDIENDKSNAAIVSTILSLARNLDLVVIAEGVENERQYQFLQEKGCDQIQGYFISKPLSVDGVRPFIESMYQQSI